MGTTVWWCVRRQWMWEEAMGKRCRLGNRQGARSRRSQPRCGRAAASATNREQLYTQLQREHI